MSETVAFVRCTGYGEMLPAAIDQAFSLSGWKAGNALSGKKVLVKPNLLTDRKPEQAVTTHPEFVRHVIRWLKQRGATVVVADSPASAANLQNVWELSGLRAVCEEEQVKLLSIEQAGVKSFTIDGFSFAIAQPVLEADYIINLPKVKSHALTLLTAAVKNIYGVLPGYSKTLLHRQYPRPLEFGRLIASIWKVIPPSITLADGIIGLEGQGPANGTPVALGFIAAAENPFALDRALCSVLKIDVRRVPYLSDGQGKVYTCVGDTIKVKSFEVPSGTHILNVLPKGLVTWLGRIVWVRPTFSGTACIRCGKCVKACPVKALTLEDATRPPLLEANLCISCCCCHEVCPADAIRMTQSFVLRALKVFKGID
jgi:uncharacterized protein (DUF362 family)/Pyruvate/2-oxoacid:ferredoxin oxidoreductase delta subunit